MQVDAMAFDGTPDCSRRIQEWAEGRVRIWAPPGPTVQPWECDQLEILDRGGRSALHIAEAGDIIVRDPRGGYRVAR